MKDLCMHLTRLSVELNKAAGRRMGGVEDHKKECIMQRCGHWDIDKRRCALNTIVNG